jgi:hypothetical protein
MTTTRDQEEQLERTAFPDRFGAFESALTFLCRQI